jgi:hypothetical protein
LAGYAHLRGQPSPDSTRFAYATVSSNLALGAKP